MYRVILFFVSFFLIFSVAFSQEIAISVTNKRVNKVIKNLGIEVSFDSRSLSKYRVTIDKSFATYDEAIEYVLKDTPYVCKNVSGVYVILNRPIDNKYLNEEIMVSKRIDTIISTIHINKLAEVVIYSQSKVYSPIMGKVSAKMDIDGSHSMYLPGSGDNAAFDLLRMMPGVRACNEPSNDLMVWGSKSGESRMIFDGIRLFGMHSFNDNISSINPYLAKKIVLKKGGYGAESGNQIGAIAEVSSFSPNLTRFSVKANIGTHTANAFMSVPIKKSASVEVAWRKTFYNLYKNKIDNIISDYSFSDLNIRVSGEAFSDDKYRVSLYGADDRFEFMSKVVADPITSEILSGGNRNLQFGASFIYDKPWSESTNSKFVFSYSSLKIINDTINVVQEFSSRFSQNYRKGNNNIIAGIEIENYSVDGENLFKPTLYVTNEYTYKNLNIEAGIRADFISERLNFQPRLSASFDFAKHFTATLSWGLYNQYVSRVPLDNSAFRWGISKNLFAMHNIAGLSFRSDFGLFISAEGFYKKNFNVFRYVDAGIVKGNYGVYGSDVFIKYDYLKGTIYSSYSLSATCNYETGHEFKLGSLVTLKPFVISANFVIGNGFIVQNSTIPYMRLDVAATYRVRVKGVQLQTGLSVMNVSNNKNVKYNETIPRYDNVLALYSYATPLSPMAFLEIIW